MTRWNGADLGSSSVVDRDREILGMSRRGGGPAHGWRGPTDQPRSCDQRSARASRGMEDRGGVGGGADHRIFGADWGRPGLIHPRQIANPRPRLGEHRDPGDGRRRRRRGRLPRALRPRARLRLGGRSRGDPRSLGEVVRPFSQTKIRAKGDPEARPFGVRAVRQARPRRDDEADDPEREKRPEAQPTSISWPRCRHGGTTRESKGWNGLITMGCR